MLNPVCISCHRSDWMWRCLQVRNFPWMLLWRAFILTYTASVVSFLGMSSPVPCRGYKTVCYKSFGTMNMPGKSDTLLKFIAHQLQNRGCIGAWCEMYFHSFHVSLNLFDRISEGKRALLEGRLFGLLAVAKRLMDVSLSSPLSQTSSSQTPGHTL